MKNIKIALLLFPLVYAPPTQASQRKEYTPSREAEKKGIKNVIGIGIGLLVIIPLCLLTYYRTKNSVETSKSAHREVSGGRLSSEEMTMINTRQPGFKFTSELSHPAMIGDLLKVQSLLEWCVYPAAERKEAVIVATMFDRKPVVHYLIDRYHVSGKEIHLTIYEVAKRFNSTSVKSYVCRRLNKIWKVDLS